MISDAEVGKLYKSIADAGDDSAYYWQEQCKELIRKLVAERALSYMEGSFELDQARALQDFEIDPTGFPDPAR
jgi:hypothetical protein